MDPEFFRELYSDTLIRNPSSLCGDTLILNPGFSVACEARP